MLNNFITSTKAIYHQKKKKETYIDHLRNIMFVSLVLIIIKNVIKKFSVIFI